MSAAVPRVAPSTRGAAAPHLRTILREPVGSALTLGAVAASLAGTVLLAVQDAWRLSGAQQLPVDATVGLTFPLAGLLVLRVTRRRGTRALAWTLLLTGSAAALTALSAALAAVAQVRSGWVDVLVQAQAWLWVPGFVPLLTLVPLLYPDGLLPGRLWRTATAASVVGIALLSAGIGLFPEDFVGRVRLPRPLADEGLARALTLIGAALLAPALLLALASLVVRWRRADPLGRRQVGVLLLAGLVLLVVTMLQGALPTPVDVLAQAVAVALLPAAIGVAVTRHRLYDLDTAVRRTLVAASLVACLTGLFLTVFALTGVVLPTGSRVAVAVAAGVTGVLLQPLARRLASSVDRIFYGDRADPYAVTAGLARRLAEAGPEVRDVPRILCETVAEALRLDAVDLWLDLGPDSRRVAAVGAPGESATAFDLRHRGRRAGWLRVEPRRGDARLEERDVALLTTIADQAAPAVAAVRLQQELLLSRQALVEAREEERRRLRRDLHDGLGATLAGIRLQVESAQALIEEGTARGLLDAADGGIAQAVSEVRTLTDDLRPPALDELGLRGALEAMVSRLAGPATEVRLEVVTLPALPAATEVAAYRIAAEATSNAVRHARATSVVVRAASRGGELVVEVADDGTGVLEPRAGGLGLESMRLRAEELGGRFEIDAVPGRGATVSAHLPLEESR